jgi:hypothetical protein
LTSPTKVQLGWGAGTYEEQRLLELRKTLMGHLMKSVLLFLSARERIHMINKMKSIIEIRKIFQEKKKREVALKITVRIHKICMTRF